MLHTDRVDLLLSLLHTLFTLTILPLLHYLTTTRPFDLSHHDRSTSHWQSAALLASVSYYLYDSIDILLHEPAPLLPPSVYYLLHHVVCAAGLLTPVMTGVDGSLVLVGLMLGELANPPRLWAQLVACQIVQLQTAQSRPAAARLSSLAVPHPKQLQHRSQVELWMLHSTLSSIHLMLFIATRGLGVWYFARVLWPHSVSGWTAVWGGAMCVFSVCTVVVYLVSSDGINIATTAVDRSQVPVALSSKSSTE